MISIKTMRQSIPFLHWSIATPTVMQIDPTTVSLANVIRISERRGLTAIIRYICSTERTLYYINPIIITRAISSAIHAGGTPVAA